MPLYEFRCPVCGDRKNELMDINGPKKLTCSCGEQMERVYSSFNFTIDFRDGYDIGLGKYFNTARERDYYIAGKEIRRID